MQVKILCWLLQVADLFEWCWYYVIGLKPGTVIITEEAVDGLLRPYMEVVSTFQYRKGPQFLLMLSLP